MVFPKNRLAYYLLLLNKYNKRENKGFEMKIIVEQKNLDRAVKQLSRVLMKKSSNPVLTMILFSVRNEELILRATDLVVGEEIKLSISKQKEKLNVLVPGKALVEAVGILGQEETEISLTEEQMILKNGKDRVNLRVLPDDGFPEFKFVLSSADEMSAGLLGEIEEKISLAVSSDISRPQLTGVYFKFDGEKLSLVGTDGFRLSLLDVKNFSNQTEGSVLVPLRVLKDVFSLVETFRLSKVQVYWETEQNRMIVVTEEFLYFADLIMAPFPPYERIVPLDFMNEVKIDREELLALLNKAQIFARDSSNVVRMKFNDQHLSVIAKGVNGQYEAELDLSTKMEEFQIAFNIKYLIDFLSVLNSDEVWWGMNENTKPVLLAEKKGASYRYVAMPFKAVD